MKCFVLTFCLLVLAKHSIGDDSIKARNIFVPDDYWALIKHAVRDIKELLFGSPSTSPRTSPYGAERRFGGDNIQARNPFIPDDWWVIIKQAVHNILELVFRSPSTSPYGAKRRFGGGNVESRNLFIVDERKSMKKIRDNIDKYLSQFPSESMSRGGIDTRIFGGKNAKYNQIPYQALLQYGQQAFCGASIIHEQWALTAAHCILDDGADKAHLIVGTIRLDGSGGEKVRIEEFIPHPDYQYVTKDETNDSMDIYVNDIALIHLQDRLDFSRKVEAVLLPSAGEQLNLEGKVGLVAGWGATETANRPEVLQIAKVLLIDQATCARSWPYVNATHLCTSVVDHKGVCVGDSGGPLIVDGRLYGVIMAAHEDCKSKPNFT